MINDYQNLYCWITDENFVKHSLPLTPHLPILHLALLVKCCYPYFKYFLMILFLITFVSFLKSNFSFKSLSRAFHPMPLVLTTMWDFTHGQWRIHVVMMARVLDSPCEHQLPEIPVLYRRLLLLILAQKQLIRENSLWITIIESSPRLKCEHSPFSKKTLQSS